MLEFEETGAGKVKATTVATGYSIILFYLLTQHILGFCQAQNPDKAEGWGLTFGSYFLLPSSGALSALTLVSL